MTYLVIEGWRWVIRNDFVNFGAARDGLRDPNTSEMQQLSDPVRDGPAPSA
jgi:hypothetical protein